MVNSIIKKQQDYFYEGKTRDLHFRKKQLIKLKALIKKYESNLIAAMKADLGKSAFETYATELGLVYEEIGLHLKNLKRWAARKRVGTPFAAIPASSFIQHEPLGCVLILAPWNYPFQLVFAPLTGAISAGNCAIIKPSESSKHTSQLIEEIINTHFDEAYLKVIQGDAEISSELTSKAFNLIFFTGSSTTGKKVMKAAAENLVPVVLELGGKSPCIVHADANLKQAAKRIIWGKCINAGQTCIAPDYLLADKTIQQQLLKEMIAAAKQLFGEDMEQSPDFGRIITSAHFERLIKLSQTGKSTILGEANPETRFFPLTLIENADNDSPVLQEEIFGPILPVLSYDSLDQAITFVRQRNRPLAAYFFTKNKVIQKLLLNTVSAGGITINDTIMHFTNSKLPFGGVGPSGMGSYHGYKSFAAFSHAKPVMKRATWIDIPLRYAPYGNKLKLIRKILK
jgi:aldehyde dehydrogenase (NAD+)